MKDFVWLAIIGFVLYFFFFRRPAVYMAPPLMVQGEGIGGSYDAATGTINYGINVPGLTAAGTVGTNSGGLAFNSY